MSVHNRLWRRWHRWFGVLLALPVLVLAVTGLILNHADRLALAQRVLPPVLAELYGPHVPDSVKGTRTADGVWVMVDQRLVSPQRTSVMCAPPFRGVILQPNQVVAGCGDELLILARNGSELERLSPAWGIPAFKGLATSASGDLVLETEQGPSVLDLDTLTATALPEAAPRQEVTVETLSPEEIPAPLLVPIEFNWERLMRDIHAGRVLGSFGWILMDLSAVFLLVLAGTGLVVWTRSRARSR